MSENYTPRLKTRYREEIRKTLNDEFKYDNVMQIPGVTKVVVNMGVGEAARDSKVINGALEDLTAITGQKQQLRRAKERNRQANRYLSLFFVASGLLLLFMHCMYECDSLADLD